MVICRIVVRVDDGAVQGSFTMTVAECKPEKLWTADVAMTDGRLVILFHAETELKSTSGCVSIAGQKYDAVMLEDKRTAEVQGFMGTPAEGTAVVISGVKLVG